jgi:Uma2 family endonuclease
LATPKKLAGRYCSAEVLAPQIRPIVSDSAKMARVTTVSSISLGAQQHIVLNGISWETYEQLLHDLQERHIRVTYDRGDLEMMAPLASHEGWKGRYGRLIEVMCEERDLDVEPLGSTTFRREDLERGLEPDECYYVQHADAIRARPGEDIDLNIDPPPDLAIEIDITRATILKQPIYAALGVPELWRFDGLRLTVLRLRDGKYDVAESSGVFPFLQMGRFQEFARRLASERQSPVLREFRDWVKTL